MTASQAILAVDPGREKCGLAVLGVADGRVLAHLVVPVSGLVSAVTALRERHPFALAAVGDRTGSAEVQAALASGIPDLTFRTVREADTTLEARRLYFADHPPRGWRRLIPRSMQLPQEAYDDYSAIALGRRFLGGGGAREG